MLIDRAYLLTVHYGLIKTLNCRTLFCRFAIVISQLIKHVHSHVLLIAFVQQLFLLSFVHFYPLALYPWSVC